MRRSNTLRRGGRGPGSRTTIIRVILGGHRERKLDFTLIGTVAMGGVAANIAGSSVKTMRKATDTRGRGHGPGTERAGTRSLHGQAFVIVEVLHGVGYPT